MNAIAIRTNRLDVWKIVARNYPSSIYKYKLFLVIEDKLKTSKDDVLKILAENGFTNFQILHSTDIEDDFSKLLCNNEFVKLYKGNTMTLTSWYIRRHYDVTKLLLLDEDVLLNDDFDIVFNYDKNAFYSYDGNIARDRTVETELEWKKLFDKQSALYTPWSNPSLHVDSKINKTKEQDDLIKIYESDYFINKAKKQRSWHISYFDQTALGMVYFDRLDYVDLRTSTSLIIMGPNNINMDKIERDVKTKKFTHLCCKSKLSILDELVKKGVLK